MTRDTNHAPSLPDFASNSIIEFSETPLPVPGTGYKMNEGKTNTYCQDKIKQTLKKCNMFSTA